MLQSMPNSSHVITLWEAMSEERLRSAKKLLDDGFYRDSMSRSYYSAYYAGTSRVMSRENSFANGYRNPSHEQLPDLISSMGNIDVAARRIVKKSLRFLRHAREDADYRPQAFISRSTALDCIHNAVLVQTILDVGRTRND